MKLLISGFKPFGPHQSNPTETLLSLLPQQMGEIEIQTVLLPVEYGTGFEVLKEALIKEPFDAVIMLGLASGRKKINIEHHAINLRHASIPDEAGVLKAFSKILDQGPSIVESTLPYQRVLEKAKEEGVSLGLSTDAGAYVCNDVFYLMRHHYPSVSSGFIHVPDEETISIEEQYSIVTWLIKQLID